MYFGYVDLHKLSPLMVVFFLVCEFNTSHTFVIKYNSITLYMHVC